MDEKIVFGAVTEILLTVVLIMSWVYGKNGVISTAVFALMGSIAGIILGFKFAER